MFDEIAKAISGLFEDAKTEYHKDRYFDQVIEQLKSQGDYYPALSRFLSNLRDEHREEFYARVKTHAFMSRDMTLIQIANDTRAILDN